MSFARGGDTTERERVREHFFKELSPSRRCRETKKEGKEGGGERERGRGNVRFSAERNPTIAENAK